MNKNHRKVIILGQVCAYEDKAPFVRSGKSVLGALEYNHEDETVRCHECGEWFHMLCTHLPAHHISARDYKLKHGLRLSIGLSSMAARNKQSVKAKARAASTSSGLRNFRKGAKRKRHSGGVGPRHEVRNLKAKCHAQLVKRLSDISRDLGKTPHYRDLRAAGINLSYEAQRLGLKPRELMQSADIDPRPKNLKGESKNGRFGEYSQAVLAELLRDFYVANGRLPNVKDWKAGLLPCPWTYIKYFGSLPTAYLEAGLVPKAKRTGGGR